MTYERKGIISIIAEETAPNNKVYSMKNYLTNLTETVRQRGISAQSSPECVLSIMISRGEKVWDFCRGCDENDCKYNIGLEGRIV